MSSYWDSSGLRLFYYNSFIATKLGAGKGMINPQVELDVSGTQQFSTGTSSSRYNNYYSKVTTQTSYFSSVIPNTTAATSSTWSNNGVTWTASASVADRTNYPSYNAFNTK